MSDIIRKYEKKANKEMPQDEPAKPMQPQLQQTVTLTDEERAMLSAPLSCTDSKNDADEEVMEDFLQEILSC